MATNPDIEALLSFATPMQAVYLRAVAKHGSMRAAARALGKSDSTIVRSMQALKKYAAKRGFAPDYDMTHQVPDGYRVRGTSTLYRDGEPVLQWVKSEVDAERQRQIINEAMAALAEELPKEKPVPAPKQLPNHLCNVYVLTDYHLGMKSWGEETGDDWDLDIAENMLYEWIAAALDRSPQAEVGIFAQLGDFLHWDGMDPVTPTSKHLLDADTRFQKLVRVAIRVIRRIIRAMLQKHKLVHVICADANHDPASSIWLREWLAAIYEDEKRISVDQSADSYYCFEWGKTSLFFHHGHKRKFAAIDDVLAAKFRDVFGRTKHSYAHMGHLHHVQSKESNLMLVEQHRTLAAPDAYASRHGFMSGRDAKVITYHKDFGEVGRVSITPDMLR